MWVEAVSTASYIDSAGEEQTVELSHWLTSLSKKVMMQIMKQQREEFAWLRQQSDYGDYDFEDDDPFGDDQDDDPEKEPEDEPEDDPWSCPGCDEGDGFWEFIKCLGEKCGKYPFGRLK